MSARTPPSIASVGPSGNGKNASEASTRPSRPCTHSRLIAIFTESTRLIWPAPIPSVASPCATTIALDFTCRQTRPREQQVAPLGLGRLARGHDLELRAVHDDDVAVLDEHPAVDLADVELHVALAAALLVLEDPHVRLLGQQRERVLVVRRARSGPR